jgi:hypothetical protein
MTRSINNPFILSAIMLSVATLNVVAPLLQQHHQQQQLKQQQQQRQHEQVQKSLRNIFTTQFFLVQ